MRRFLTKHSLNDFLPSELLGEQQFKKFFGPINKWAYSKKVKILFFSCLYFCCSPVRYSFKQLRNETSLDLTRVNFCSISRVYYKSRLRHSISDSPRLFTSLVFQEIMVLDLLASKSTRTCYCKIFTTLNVLSRWPRGLRGRYLALKVDHYLTMWVPIPPTVLPLEGYLGI